ncbi:MAG: response regulator [Oscillospiraceae bacterium]|nr:response regulator [Oscillospiraceae bacterium]
MKKSILIISDSINTNAIFKAVLSSDYIVDATDSTTEALEILVKRQPNLILSTLNHKKSNCFDFFADLRKREEPLKSIPVVIITANVTAEMISKSHKYEVSDFAKLPVEPISFCRKIQNVLLKFGKPYERLDPVTGLHKKQFAEEQIIEMLNEGKKGALMLIEVDRYSYAGSKVSNNALKACKEAVTDIVENEVMVASTCDGFIVFAPNLKTKAEVETLGTSIVDAMLKRAKEPMYVSIGLAVSERHGVGYADLYQNCDMGLGLARQDGKNKAKFYKW